MPRISIPGKFKVSFYSADCKEPVHVHVKYQDASCKVWIDSWTAVDVVRFKPHQVNQVIQVLKASEKLIREKWNEHCCKDKKKK